MIKFLSRLPQWLFTGITLVLILWLTLAPKPLGDDAPSLFPGADKIAHGLMFGFLTMMMLLDWQRRNQWRPTSWIRSLTDAACASLLGILIEFAQAYMNLGRGFEYADMVADTIGSFTIAIVWMFFQKFWANTYQD